MKHAYLFATAALLAAIEAVPVSADTNRQWSSIPLESSGLNKQQKPQDSEKPGDRFSLVELTDPKGNKKNVWCGSSNGRVSPFTTTSDLLIPKGEADQSSSSNTVGQQQTTAKRGADLSSQNPTNQANQGGSSKVPTENT
ncbi:hypothetical protein BDV33DRAFT_210610 [Aspergillus novoparasiticus]|uniref:Uncharacterized protein n=1 Tax=Aspergillus novoparasiticus TaxID=986946 RepID=A0A5N6E626_9EURO|nr:hypothetical protein BDV33DRAFT_210610 [Aspergillus novoparasiticus]